MSKAARSRPGRGFVLHSADYFIDNSTLPIDDGVSLTATVDILQRHRRAARGPTGPSWRSAMPAGAAGQLESEIRITAG